MAEYVVQQINYQDSGNADNHDPAGDAIKSMVKAGWEVHTADMSGFPYVRFLWQRAGSEPDSDSGARA